MDKQKGKRKLSVDSINKNHYGTAKAVAENGATGDVELKFCDKSVKFKLNFEVDLLATFLFVCGVATRMYKLNEPHYVV